MHERRKAPALASRRETRSRNGSRFGDRALDEVDRRLLASLTEDARASAAELARRVGMSAPAVRERIARLEETGVIRGYRLDVDPAALGLPVAAWVRIRPGPGQLTKVTDLAARLSEVSECHRISGEDCFLLKVHAPSIEAMEDVLDRLLLHGQTISSFVVSTPVPPRLPSPS
jgi:Lrp/AsnC family transcriptional regulator, leucine-responsive regulatory protein